MRARICVYACVRVSAFAFVCLREPEMGEEEQERNSERKRIVGAEKL
jgi:hypothetical protein